MVTDNRRLPNHSVNQALVQPALTDIVCRIFWRNAVSSVQSNIRTHQSPNVANATDFVRSLQQGQHGLFHWLARIICLIFPESFNTLNLLIMLTRALSLWQFVNRWTRSPRAQGSLLLMLGVLCLWRTGHHGGHYDPSTVKRTESRWPTLTNGLVQPSHFSRAVNCPALVCVLTSRRIFLCVVQTW